MSTPLFTFSRSNVTAPRGLPTRPAIRRSAASAIKAAAATVIVAVTLPQLSGCNSSASVVDPRSADQLVQLGSVTSAEASAPAFSGVVAARVQSNLGFRVPGKVVERLVDAGEPVRKGQLLLRLDQTDYGHAVAAQRGTVEAARARQVQAAADEERFRSLVESGAVSRSDYDRAKAGADSAQALLSAAEAQLQMAHDEGEYSALVADADGIVVDTAAEPGQYVAAGEIVIRVARAGPREASVSLPETVRPAIGSRASVTLYDGSGGTGPYLSRLRQLSDAADPVTRTFEGRYVLEGAAAKAPLGTTVTVRLDTAPTNELAVPLAAVNDRGEGPGIWIYDRSRSTVSFQKVNFLRFDGERAIVAGGLNVGDPIVAMGGQLLHPDQRVRVDAAQLASL